MNASELALLELAAMFAETAATNSNPDQQAVMTFAAKAVRQKMEEIGMDAR